MDRLNELPTSPIISLQNAVAFSVMDWASQKSLAWVYGIVLGWDDECFYEFNKKFGWDKDGFERLKNLHNKFIKLRELYESRTPDELAADIARLDEYDKAAKEYGIDAKTMLELAKSQIKTAKHNTELQEKYERLMNYNPYVKSGSKID